MVQSTALVPLVGYLLIVNGGTIDFLNRNFDKYPIFLLHAQTRLFIMYYGLILLGLGVIIYNLRCPQPIKQFDNEDAYARNMMDSVVPGSVYAGIIARFGENPFHNPTYAEQHNYL
jgi:hypothetical protein